MLSELPESIDPNLYLNRWIALVRSRVVGVGHTRDQAHRAAKRTRPKDKPALFFVDGQGQVTAEPLSSAVPGSVEPAPWLTQHPLLRQVVALLRENDPPAYLVGGAVRDFLLGRPQVTDLDFAVPANGVELARTVANRLGAAFFPLDTERGTGRAVFDEPDGTKFYLDFASFRGPDLHTDLIERDFSINAIALSLGSTPEIIDPLRGVADLRAGLIRASGPTAFTADPVRVLRAVRLAGQFGFTIEANTAALIREAAPLLPQVSPERQRDELMKLLQTPQPGQAVQRLRQLSILPHLLPDVTALSGVMQSPPHHLDVFDHTTTALDVWPELSRQNWPDLPAALRTPVNEYLAELLAGQYSRQELMPLALLLHDTGKPAAREVVVEGGQERARFLGHEQLSADVARRVMRHFRFSGQAADFVEAVVANHMRPLNLTLDGQVSRRAVYRFFRDTSGVKLQAGVATALHALADHYATYPPGSGEAELAALRETVARLIGAYVEERDQVVDPPPLLTGRDLIDEVGVSEGRLIGALLRQLKEAQAAGQISSRAEALAFVRATLNS